MASLAHFFVGLFLVLTGEVIALHERDHSDDGSDIMVMDEEELLGLFDVMGSLVDDPGWAKQHPLPCTDTPWPGVECEIGLDPPTFHVTKIHIGPDVVDPPCKTSANLSDSLLKLPYLKTLSIFYCFVSSLVNLSPTVFGALSSLEHLALESNPALFGEIPPSLANIASLRVLSLSQNSLQGKIPGELGRLVSLQQLDLSYNKLSGEIPEEIGGLKSLSILDLSWNSLQGQVPCSLGMLQLLQKIDLGSNKLNGSLPPALGKLNRLVLLDLSHNFINGPIPENLSGLEQLQYLIVDHNPIHSTVPFFVGTLKSLTSISFSGCELTGRIPNFISSLNSLTALSLDNNNLSGTVPPSLGSLPTLHQLNLSHNQLSGELQLSEEFINRLGKRLDVRGNPGLCRSNYKLCMKKNISLTYLHQITPCLGKQIGDDNKTCQNHPDDPNDGKRSSNAQWLLYQKLLSSSTLVLYWVIILL
ncbi:hypothetical protein ACOSQ3_011777 [Xanthoceras sorbifolium]